MNTVSEMRIPWNSGILVTGYYIVTTIKVNHIILLIQQWLDQSTLLRLLSSRYILPIVLKIFITHPYRDDFPIT